MSARALAVTLASIRSLRNLEHVEIAPSPRFNVVSGDNGQGKTSVLEAIYLGCTSKSFRTARLAELVRHGDDVGSVRLAVREEGEPGHAVAARVQSVGLRGGARHVRLDDKRPPSLAAYAVATPVVLFHPGEVMLSMGASSERRRLLDRVALYTEPSSLADLDAYTRALRARQKALETRGTAARDLPEWEELVVRHGRRVVEARRRAAEELVPATATAFARIAAPGLVLAGSYRTNVPADDVAYASALEESRARDVHRKSASIGPHRDDLVLTLDGHVARPVASQGQHRAIVLALKAGEIEVVSRARGVRPILLLDDVSSELDRDRMQALLGFLSEQRGQVFLTTTRPELIATSHLGQGSDRADFRVIGGRVEAMVG